jgi:CheY-like chemotaxis protein
VPTLLVADDNPVTLRFFAEAFAELGVVCDLVADGGEAVERARRRRYDALLLDARMPVLGGIEALERIRSGTGPSREAVAIATTAETGEAAHRALVESGFAEVVAKPVTVGALRALLARHFGDATQDPDTAAEPGRLDDDRALAAVGGDASILAALRGLLVAELDALPAEIEAIAARGDSTALRERLHRLDASAGFCGAPGLAASAARLRAAVESGHDWPDAATRSFLEACREVRARLVDGGASA